MAIQLLSEITAAVTTPVDADLMLVENATAHKKMTWANLKATLFQPDTDFTLTIGRARLYSTTADNMMLSHFNFSGAGNFALRQTPAGRTNINAVSGQSVFVSIDGTDRWRFSNNGNFFNTGNNQAIGVNTTAPNAKIHIVSDAAETFRMYRTGGGGSNVEFYGDNTTAAVTNVEAGRITMQVQDAGNGQGVWYVREPGGTTIINQIQTHQTHEFKLDAYFQSGITRITQSAAAGAAILRLNSPDDGICRVDFGDVSDADVGWILYDHTIDSMQFVTNGATRMAINSAGQVGIGVTTPNYLLDLRGSGTPGVQIYNNVAAAGFNMYMEDGGGVQLRTAGTILIGASNTVNFRVEANGNTLTQGVHTATNFQLGSDIRKKDIIGKLGGSEIEYVHYRMKDHPEVDRFGVVANQVAEVLPEVVSEDEDGMLKVSYIDLLIHEVARLTEKVKDLETKL